MVNHIAKIYKVVGNGCPCRHLAAPRRNKPFDARKDVFIRTTSITKAAVSVLDLSGPVYGHLATHVVFYQKVHDLFVEEETIGGKGEVYRFPAPDLFFSDIRNDLFDKSKLKEWFAAEEDDAQVFLFTRIFDQEVDPLFCNFKGHPGRFSAIQVRGVFPAIVSASAVTITAAQVASMGNHKLKMPDPPSLPEYGFLFYDIGRDRKS